MTKTFDLILRGEEGPSIEEAVASVKEAFNEGFDSVNITGSEPMDRKDIVKMVKAIGEEVNPERFAITTNGQKLAAKVDDLKVLGVTQAVIKLSTFLYASYKPENEGDTLEAVVESINACVNAGMTPVRLIMQVEEGVNDNEVLDFLQLTLMHDYEVVFVATESVSEEAIKAKMPAMMPMKTEIEGLEAFKYPSARGKLCFPVKGN